MIRPIALALLGSVLLAAGPATAQDSSEFVVRLNRVEGQMRQLSGQVEQLQFENRQLKEALRKFQEDTEFRFQERSGGRSTGTPAPAGGGSATPPRPARRSDAFDPAADPSAPGSPRTLGQSGPPPPVAGLPPAAASREPDVFDPGGPGRRGAPVGALDDDDDDAPAPRQPLGSGPLDLGAAGRGAPVSREAGMAPPPGRTGEPGRLSEPGRASDPQAAAPRPPSVASTGTDDPRADYDVAYAYLIQRQYDRAEMAFRGFLQSHPRDRLVPDATYWLGESYLQRNRPREAAEQFLKVTTDHARSAKAPDAMLKLGMSLSALGAKDQACATLAEAERKYPSASPSVRQGIDREQKRVRCTS